MARLRKASSPTEPPIIIPTTTMRTTRSSPRKTVRESPSTRELRYTAQDNEEAFLVPKIPASLSESPKKQRALKPVASNSRLLRKLSNESLATPEKRNAGRNATKGDGMKYSYARSLVKTGMGKEKKQIELQVEETVVDEGELDRSLLCDDDEVGELDEQQMTVEPKVENEEDEDDESVVDVRSRRTQRQNHVRAVVLDSDSDSEEDQDDEEKSYSTEADEPTSPHVKKMEPEPKSIAEIQTQPRLPFRKGHSTISNWAQGVIDLTGSPTPSASFTLPQPSQPPGLMDSSRPTSSSSNDVDAMLHFSPTPTKFRSPRKAPPLSRPCTPPAPPASPSKLVSPSKKKPRIPTEPTLRPSLDAFWNPEVVGDWNDKHSPSKPLFSPRKQKWLHALDQGIYPSQAVTIDSDSDPSFDSPTTSPRKKTTQSPTKKTSKDSSPTVAQIRAQRKAFSAQKHALAESFLTKLDTTITDGKITTLSAPTGGIKLIWSKTLKTTAGRANWRREQIRLRTGPSPTDIKTEIRHHCSIELAEKVIDDSDRLYNVLAHEYCHLTTFMISNIRNNPHGAEFKTWATRVSGAFAHLNVNVTTKHSYDIAYKYVWECVTCGYEFKRHSKSVDPGRHSCGKCKGKLVQTKPTPRGVGAGGAGRGGLEDGKVREKSGYQIFVKENFARVKRELEGRGLEAQMGRVMEEVARQYRVEKERRKEEEAEKEVGDVEIAFEGLKIGS